ncbi:MAG: ATP-binding protein, partial [Candidatus Aenigmarchaeota archaeon]|nr:ATP-binding protein [Candidatus Aenigmarchaeota archaeon]
MDCKKIIVQWQEFQIPEVLPREIRIDMDHDFITTVTGPRRAGKTYLCFQKVRSLLKEGVRKGNVLYINFEDEKLLGADAEDLDMLLDTFYELSDMDGNQKIYLFLDELQNVKNWDVWVRRIYDMDKNLKIVLTGSSSKMLSREISTKLRGRILNIEVFPLSFTEFLGWKKVPHGSREISHSKERFGIKKAFSSYLSGGGYPSLLVNENVPKETILQGYLQSMIFKDIVERYGIKDVKKLQILAKLLFESTSREISYSRLANRMKSLGFSMSKNTVIEFISHFEDAYLFFQNLKYDYSLAKQLGSIKKIYCIDNGLLNAVSFKFSDDAGKLAENLVFIELKRRHADVFYHRNKHECDFLIREKDRVTGAIQVTTQLNEENYKREVKGLIEAMDTHGLKDGIIITDDME